MRIFDPKQLTEKLGCVNCRFNKTKVPYPDESDACSGCIDIGNHISGMDIFKTHYAYKNYYPNEELWVESAKKPKEILEEYGRHIKIVLD